MATNIILPTFADTYRYGHPHHSDAEANPSLAGSANGGMAYRNLGARLAAMGGGGDDPYHGYVGDGLVLMLDGEDGWDTSGYWTSCVGDYNFKLNEGYRLNNHLECIGFQNNFDVTQALVDAAGVEYTIEIEIDYAGVTSYGNTGFTIGRGYSYFSNKAGNNTQVNILGAARTINASYGKKYILTSTFDRANWVSDVFINGSLFGHYSESSYVEIHYLTIGTKMQIGTNGLAFRGLRIYSKKLSSDEVARNAANYLTKTW